MRLMRIQNLCDTAPSVFRGRPRFLATTGVTVLVFAFRCGGACRELPFGVGRPRTLRFNFWPREKR